MLDKRITKLIEKLGFTEYEWDNTLEFYQYTNPNGILQSLSNRIDEQNEVIILLMEHLGIEVHDGKFIKKTKKGKK